MAGIYGIPWNWIEAKFGKKVANGLAAILIFCGSLFLLFTSYKLYSYDDLIQAGIFLVFFIIVLLGIVIVVFSKRVK